VTHFKGGVVYFKGSKWNEKIMSIFKDYYRLDLHQNLLMLFS